MTPRVSNEGELRYRAKQNASWIVYRVLQAEYQRGNVFTSRRGAATCGSFTTGAHKASAVPTCTARE